MKHAIALALLALATTACASNESKSTATCKPAPSELVVQDLGVGSGETARFRTAVLVNYKGWLYDGCAPDLKGALFDESTTMPLSVMVGVGRVIRGWDEGLIGMKEGGKRRLVIPSHKAYGAQAAGGGKIPPNSTLVFDVDLVKVIAQPPAQ